MTGPAAGAPAVAAAAVRAPFTGRARRDIAFCVLTLPLILPGPVRPTPAIETIAYFCAAELLANAAKHSEANTIKIFITERSGLLALQITDDGLGGADPARGSGLSGLAQRVAVVDGRLDIASPPGGPTRITVELPLRAGRR